MGGKQVSNKQRPNLSGKDEKLHHNAIEWHFTFLRPGVPDVHAINGGTNTGGV